MDAESGESSSKRDLSRAHWQRSVGALLMNELLGDFFPTNDPSLTEAELEACDTEAKSRYSIYGEKSYFSRAYAVSHYLVGSRLFDQKFANKRFKIPSEVQAGVAAFTFRQNLGDVITEGLRGQAFFPINLVRDISRHAQSAGKEEFRVNSLDDIAGMLTRSDFQEMVHDATLTKNGYWGGYTLSQTGLRLESFDFSGGGVRFNENVTKELRFNLSRVNKRGVSYGEDVSRLTSSGCPARHFSPYFNDSELDLKMQKVLSKYFKTSKEELSIPLDETIITQGLNYVAKGLHEAHNYFEQAEDSHHTL